MLKLVHWISHTIICNFTVLWFQEVFNINFVNCIFRNILKEPCIKGLTWIQVWFGFYTASRAGFFCILVQLLKSRIQKNSANYAKIFKNYLFWYKWYNVKGWQGHHFQLKSTLGVIFKSQDGNHAIRKYEKTWRKHMKALLYF